jgi:hypothetical protein
MSTTKAEARAKLRGVEVRLVDFTSLEEKATVWGREHHPDLGDNAVLTVGFAPWGLLKAADGATILVCNEGVGYLLTDDEATTARVSFYSRTPREGSTFISMAPVASMPLTLAEAEELTTGETVDLTEFVRTFGQRLEDNLRGLHHRATVNYGVTE